MIVTERGKLNAEDERRLLAWKAKDDATEEVHGTFKRVVVEMVGKSSYREVGRLTCLSTNTLQRWKREAGK